MTFWREAHWQQAAADAIGEALDSVHTSLKDRGVNDGVWTTEIMRAVGALTSTLCHDGVCAYKGSPSTPTYAGGELMYDLTWFVPAPPGPHEVSRVRGVPLVLESEWHGWHNVWDDFDKLLLARAGLRVFIFECDKATPDNWVEVLLARAAAFADASQDDAWLLCAWSGSGFSCHPHIRPIA